MKKRIAVVLLRLPGGLTLPKSYLDRLFTTAGSGTGNVLDYFGAVSHGRLDLTGNRVFDWIDYGHSLDDLAAAVQQARDAKKQELLAGGASDAEAEAGGAAHAHRFRRTTIKQWAREAAARERDNALAARRIHKMTAVLLHELGHNLGSPHDRAADTLMNEHYSHRAASFTAEARATIQATLDDRLGRSKTEPSNSDSVDSFSPPWA